MQPVQLKPHWAWSQLPGAATFQSFQATYNSNTFLMPAVPSSIRLDVEMLHRIIAQSYFEYELLELAKLQLYLIFEKALQLRYKEVYGNSTHQSLCWLFRHFDANRNFECSGDFSTSVRQLQNYHDARLMQWPGLQGGSIQWLQEIVACINDLYEDEKLRFHRMVETNRVNRLLKKLVYPFFCGDDGKYQPCINIQCLFYNNKLPQPKIYIGVISADISQPLSTQTPRLLKECYAIEKMHYSGKNKVYICNLYQADGCIWISSAANFILLGHTKQAQALLDATGDTLLQPYHAAKRLLQQKSMELREEMHRIPS